LSDEIQASRNIKPEFAIELYIKLGIFWVNINQDINDEQFIKTTTEYLEKAKEVSLQMQDTVKATAGMYFLRAAVYHGRHKFDSARIYYLQFLECGKQPGFKLNVSRNISTQCNIADTYLQQNNPKDAMVYINNVKKLCKDPDKSNYLSFFLAFTGLLEGKALYQLKEYNASVKVLKEALQKIETTGGHLRGEVVEAYKIMADDYKALGNYKEALTTDNMFITLNDSLTKKEKTDMINRLVIRYRLEEKNQELVRQRYAITDAENKIKGRNIVIIGVLSLFIVLALLLIIWRKQNLHKQKLQQQSIENLQQKIKIERLNATIAGEEKERTRIARELHDGIGGLLTAAKLNFESYKKNEEQGSKEDFIIGLKLLEDAGTELRQAAKNLMPQILLQEGLVTAVNDFCERIAQRNNIDVHFQVLGEKKPIDAHLELTIYRIIQELLHNIVKHSHASNAIVQLNFHEDGGMSITVEDNGVGFNKANIAAGQGGMGLQNIKERIKEFGGRLDISTDAGQGTSFFIEFESI
jgi:signal transduction histidine kinase